ncbi:Protein of unknown function [Caminicella sporogenes DSM 14501]|uniref:DUF3006 domain-containing protein n=1 Tax=Caminicella sporogenes DSM 14501 TaxID=1121266 RepID=A0A1M6RTM2_9FIRM|nr:DUF3006 domain-containing protein [Caminicella sporogenes]RKD23651.1 pyruvate kinase [Caminicella sporogenes]SHK35783.1 Protein of unknown function [Caminicella sporogenes DSM 14501]
MKVLIDRFEGDYAVCERENREIINIEKYKIPKEAKEGDVLIIENDRIIIDKEETEKRKKEIEALTDDIWE